MGWKWLTSMWRSGRVRSDRYHALMFDILQRADAMSSDAFVEYVRALRPQIEDQGFHPCHVCMQREALDRLIIKDRGYLLHRAADQMDKSLLAVARCREIVRDIQRELGIHHETPSR